MEELIKEHYNLIDRMAIKLEEICNDRFGAILCKHNLKRLTTKIVLVDDEYWFPINLFDMFTKSSDYSILSTMSDEQQDELVEELEETFDDIFCNSFIPKEAVDLMLEEMMLNYKKRGDYNFIIKNK